MVCRRCAPARELQAKPHYPLRALYTNTACSQTYVCKCRLSPLLLFFSLRARLAAVGFLRHMFRHVRLRFHSVARHVSLCYTSTEVAGDLIGRHLVSGSASAVWHISESSGPAFPPPSPIFPSHCHPGPIGILQATCLGNRHGGDVLVLCWTRWMIKRFVMGLPGGTYTGLVKNALSYVT